jgi:hypothetical protein
MDAIKDVAGGGDIMSASLPEKAIWGELDALERELGGDVRYFWRTRRHQTSQHWRRAYCRAVSAYFEAITSWMARYTVMLYHPGQLGDGERRTLESRFSALERAYHALDLFTNTAGAESPLQEESGEWKALADMIRIRNRIVHPRRSQDVLITEDDLSAIERAANVIVRLFSEALRRAADALTQRANELQNEWQRTHGVPSV